MAMGTGLGAFMDGFGRGIGIGRQLRQAWDEGQQKRDMQAAAKEAKDQFGDVLNDDAYAYMMKRRAAQLAESGDIEGARKYLEFSEKAETKQGAKLFANALSQFQRGDVAGGFETAGKLAQLKGYGDQFQIGSVSPITDQQGNTIGTRITVKSPDGQDIAQDIPLGREAEVLARIASPEAVYQFDQARAAEERKQQTEIDTYEKKKQIDQRYGGAGKNRASAIKALRKGREFGPEGKTFDELSDKEKEDEIQKEMRLQEGPGIGTGGASSAPGLGRRVIVDTATGEPVQSPPSRAAAASAGAPPASRPEPPRRPAGAPAPAGITGAAAVGAWGVPRRQDDGKPRGAWGTPIR